MGNTLDFQKGFGGLRRLSVVPPESYFLSLYMKLLILPVNKCFCYHSGILICPWYAMWQLLLQPDVIFPLKWAAFSKPSLHFAFLSPCSDLSAVFESRLSNQTKIRAPHSPHINPSLVSHLQLCLIQGLLSVSILHGPCCCISNASQRLAINRAERKWNCFSRSPPRRHPFPHFFLPWVDLILPQRCCCPPLCFDSFLASPFNPPSLLHPSTSPHFAPLMPGLVQEDRAWLCSSQPWLSSPPVSHLQTSSDFTFVFFLRPRCFMQLNHFAG